MFVSEKCVCCSAYASVKQQSVMLHMFTKG